MPRGSIFSVQVIEKVWELAQLGYSPGDIAKKFRNNKQGLGFGGTARVPKDARTVTKIIAEFMPRQPSEPWTFNDSDAEDAAAVLTELAIVVRDTEARVSSFTVAQAALIAKLKRALPDLPPFSAYRLALAYLKREEEKKPTAGLDLLLAVAPWRSRERLQDYELGLKELGLPSPPSNIHRFLWADMQNAKPSTGRSEMFEEESEEPTNG